MLAPLASRAEIRLPKLLSDHMVIQREIPIHIWGWSDPGEKVSVRFHGQDRSTAANDLGQWSVYLAPEHAGGPFQITVQGTNTVTISDVLVGDIWIASGQSNMEMPMVGFPGSAVLKNGAEEIAHADHPQMRLLRMPNRSSDYPLSDIDADWAACTPETAAKFSAVAYFFGREIQQREKVPVGLIDTSWGGTPVEAWVSLDGLSADSSLMPVFAERAQMMDKEDEVPLMVAKEQRADEAAKAAGQPLPSPDWHPDQRSWMPAGLYNGMIAPFTPFPIKGAIWYQGESNGSSLRAPMYEKVFSTMISDWRNKWDQGNFPFLFVQISSFTASPADQWGMLRDAQRRTLALTNTAMAVTLDVGDPGNVHPSDKQTVGARLALAGRALAYGEPIEYSGPLYRQAVPESGSMRIWFDHAKGLSTKGGTLEGFEVAGVDGRFVKATAKIDGVTVVADSPDVKDPVYVRYAWPNAPAANLYNGAGLPASTFTSQAVPQAGSGTGDR